MSTEPEKQEHPAFEPGIVEALAFSLFCSEEIEPDTLDAARAKWQASLEIRSNFRKCSNGVLRRLEAQGLRLRPHDSKLLARELDWMKTIPPRPAYTDDEMSSPQ